MSTISTPSFALYKKVGSKSFMPEAEVFLEFKGVAVYYEKVPDWHIGLTRVLLSHWYVWVVAFGLDGLYKIIPRTACSIFVYSTCYNSV